ncbi:uncharacterized protein A1O9_08740 [Exophiala aquamarina CBS 119918]|uniref:GST C-terminal domain-containing protein n=1 Tax=Exophiala aquamarina CBS 119918 TaxID=1182545 RepID=A0A072P5T8_9EURO|nr:uncharacterized protein A1O9_08740 [Exophiala aquamarina CBS 119918]KEF55087.1 hypothetical protein A1O9_08740 [Exophiala aquamarina CBS 119918]
MAGIGPMQGQANHFVRYSLSDLPEKYSTDRYINESRRLYRTVDKHLSDSKTKFLVGNKLTIADIAISSWANLLTFSGLDATEFPNVQGWQGCLSQPGAFRKGFDVPVKTDVDGMMNDPETFKAYLKKNEEWTRKGMEEDAKR